MGKKKKMELPEKSKRLNGGLGDFDITLNKQYKEIVDDIEIMQYKIYQADKKKQKKQKKKMKKKGKVKFYEPKSKKARIKAANKLTGKEMFEKIKQMFEDLKPFIIVIAKLIMTLIVAILSMDIVKEKISKKAMQRIDTIYQLCASVS